MERTKHSIEELAGPLVADFDAFLVDLTIQQGRKRKVVQVFVDTDQGITVDQCAEISRRLAKELDGRNMIPGPYELHVSSPGLEKPLKLLRQYRKNVGRKFRVRLRTEAEPRTIEAILEAVEDDRLSFRVEDGGITVVAFSDVLESREVLPW